MRVLIIPVFALAVLGPAAVAQAQDAPKLFFEGDLVTGTQQGAPVPSCVLASQFKHGQRIVWRVRVLDRDGKSLDDKGLKSLVALLPDGQKINMRFHGHPPQPPQTDFFWAGAWIVPGDYPSGTFAYKIVATDLQGHEQTWEPFKVAASQLTILADALEIKK